ncbi:MAG: heme-binding protein [Thiohalocapsa sp.]|jgi:hypothetical protein|nr:heme-binding protein [Thiohalocapsa sp.]
MTKQKKRQWIIATILAVIGIIVLAAMSVPEPDFDVVDKGDGFELRRYAPFVVAETDVEGTFEDASTKAFPLLVGYIKGNNYGGRSVPMAAPVRQQPLGDEADGTAWRVQFVMPKEYQTSLLPKPVDERVTLRQLPAGLVAAHRYGGDWSKEDYLAHRDELRSALEAAGLKPIGNAIFARYNAPLIPWFIRRNEVLVPVEQT